MKKYEVIPQVWDEQEKDYIGDLMGTTSLFATYKEAKAEAKKLDAARIDCYYIPREDFDDDEEYEEACEWLASDYDIWTESYRNGVQVPAVYINGKAIMRWTYEI